MSSHLCPRKASNLDERINSICIFYFDVLHNSLINWSILWREEMGSNREEEANG